MIKIRQSGGHPDARPIIRAAIKKIPNWIIGSLQDMLVENVPFERLPRWSKLVVGHANPKRAAWRIAMRSTADGPLILVAVQSIDTGSEDSFLQKDLVQTILDQLPNRIGIREILQETARDTLVKSLNEAQIIGEMSEHIIATGTKRERGDLNLFMQELQKKIKKS